MLHLSTLDSFLKTNFVVVPHKNWEFFSQCKFDQIFNFLGENFAKSLHHNCIKKTLLLMRFMLQLLEGCSTQSPWYPFLLKGDFLFEKERKALRSASKLSIKFSCLREPSPLIDVLTNQLISNKQHMTSFDRKIVCIKNNLREHQNCKETTNFR